MEGYSRSELHLKSQTILFEGGVHAFACSLIAWADHSFGIENLNCAQLPVDKTEPANIILSLEDC